MVFPTASEAPLYSQTSYTIKQSLVPTILLMRTVASYSGLYTLEIICMLLIMLYLLKTTASTQLGCNHLMHCVRLLFRVA